MMSGSSIGKRAALTLVLRVPLFESEDFDKSSSSLLDVADVGIGKRTALTLVPRVPFFKLEDFGIFSSSQLDVTVSVVGK